MALKDGIYTGEITLRGGTFIKGEISTITVLEVGEHSLRDVKVTEFMMNYLDRAAERREATVLGIQEGMLVAVGQHGVTKDALEIIDEAMKRVMLAFWIFFCPARHSPCSSHQSPFHLTNGGPMYPCLGAGGSF